MHLGQKEVTKLQKVEGKETVNEEVTKPKKYFWLKSVWIRKRDC